MALVYDSYWHELTCDQCQYSFDAINGRKLWYRGQEYKIGELAHCPHCNGSIEPINEPKVKPKDWGAF